MTIPVIRNISDTAFMAAAYRAIESSRADPLFRDPLADKLAGERGRAIIEILRVSIAIVFTHAPPTHRQ